MNEIEKQILHNQSTIMAILKDNVDDSYWIDELEDRIEDTNELLNPKQSPPLPSKTEGALSENHNKGDGSEESTPLSSSKQDTSRRKEE